MPVKHAEMAEVFMQAFKSLKKKDKDDFFEKLLKVKEYREDLIDLAIIEARKNEPKIPLRECCKQHSK